MGMSSAEQIGQEAAEQAFNRAIDRGKGVDAAKRQARMVGKAVERRAKEAGKV